MNLAANSISNFFGSAEMDVVMAIIKIYTRETGYLSKKERPNLKIGLEVKGIASITE